MYLGSPYSSLLQDTKGLGFDHGDLVPRSGGVGWTGLTWGNSLRIRGQYHCG